MTEVLIRRARPDDNGAVHALVQVIADETFGSTCLRRGKFPSARQVLAEGAIDFVKPILCGPLSAW